MNRAELEQAVRLQEQLNAVERALRAASKISEVCHVGIHFRDLPYSEAPVMLRAAYPEGDRLLTAEISGVIVNRLEIRWDELAEGLRALGVDPGERPGPAASPEGALSC